MAVLPLYLPKSSWKHDENKQRLWHQKNIFLFFSSSYFSASYSLLLSISFLICKMGTVTLYLQHLRIKWDVYTAKHIIRWPCTEVARKAYFFLLFSFYMIVSFHSGAYFIYNKGTSSLYHTGKSSQVRRSISYYYINEL